MKNQIKIASLKQLPEVAQQILSSCAGSKIFAFLGEMGSGKTTIIAALCNQLGVQEHISSPTFAIVNEYAGAGIIFHLDLFRLQTIDEALAIGIEEYLSGNEYCFVEWPQLIEPLLPVETVHISITVTEDQQRILTITLP
ncbi:MAG: tRNA (adenosine(37)-N6)-threonylcarbamoyltransferase complex ATPase subunit type 1 TsaE [Chitinophagaceae bacterium]|nr:tRNA (adenosine(37)-N6)-threonylcarbamoyltransferase complex ATPase subunit type 1 TsaE [Chitinophagaceae bacterium]